MSIWSPALRPRRGDLAAAGQMHAHEWERPVRAGLAALIGPIRQELLSGIRETAHWKRLRDALRPFRDLLLAAMDYERAAERCNRRRARGVVGSVVDMLICAAATRYRAPIYTVDTDFRRYAPILRLQLYAPAARAGETG